MTLGVIHMKLLQLYYRFVREIWGMVSMSAIRRAGQLLELGEDWGVVWDFPQYRAHVDVLLALMRLQILEIVSQSRAMGHCHVQCQSGETARD